MGTGNPARAHRTPKANPERAGEAGETETKLNASECALMHSKMRMEEVPDQIDSFNCKPAE